VRVYVNVDVDASLSQYERQQAQADGVREN
jgi:hypothetical protein